MVKEEEDDREIQLQESNEKNVSLNYEAMKKTTTKNRKDWL